MRRLLVLSAVALVGCAGASGPNMPDTFVPAPCHRLDGFGYTRVSWCAVKAADGSASMQACADPCAATYFQTYGPGGELVDAGWE